MELTFNRQMPGKKRKSHFILKHVFKMLVSNPEILLVIVVVTVAIIVYIMYQIDVQLTSIMVQYESLSARVSDSKADFDKRLFYITVDDKGNTTVTLRTQSEVIQEQMEEMGVVDPGAVGGGITDLPPITGDASTLVSIITSSQYNLNSHFKVYADQYGYVYDEIIKAGYPSEFAFGVVANLSSEGTAGMVQGTYTLVTKNQLEGIATAATRNSSNSTGVGLMQWTYYSYMPELLRRYEHGGVFNVDGTIDVNKATIVETNWILEKCRGAYSGAQAAGCSTPQQYAEYWCDILERPSQYCGRDSMRYCEQRQPWGSACETRAKRADLLSNEMRK